MRNVFHVLSDGAHIPSYADATDVSNVVLFVIMVLAAVIAYAIVGAAVLSLVRKRNASAVAQACWPLTALLLCGQLVVASVARALRTVAPVSKADEGEE